MKLHAILFGTVALIVAAAIAAGIYFVYTKQNTSSLTTDGKASISGTVNFTALKPDPGDQGSLTVKSRKYQSTAEFQSTGVVVALQDNVPWTWNDALSGDIYEIIVELDIDGKNIKQSEPVVVTAPAQGQELPLRITWKDLPESVVQDQMAPISGQIQVHGYIPTGASMILQSREVNGGFTAVQNFSNPQPLQDFSWPDAQPLKDYFVKAVLIVNGQEMGDSQEVPAVGSESDINLTVNSKAQPAGASVTPTPTPAANNNQPTPTPAPVPQGTISGTVTINGPQMQGTSLVILWRHPGDTNYQTLTTINNPSYNGATWSWNDGVVGRAYEITALLKVNGTFDNGNAKSQTVTAPAQNVNFTINTGVTLSTPPTAPSVVSCNFASGTRYNVTVRWPVVSGAQQYWLEIGNSLDPTSVRGSHATPPSSGDVVLTTDQVEQNRNYFMRYAYSTCANCTSDSTFSNYSSTARFYCGNDPGANTPNDQ